MTNMVTRATAQVAPFLEAIAKAREAGLTWGDIAARLGIESPDRVRWASGHCRYKAEQIPLPEPKPTIGTTTTTQKPAGQSQPFDINSLPRIGGR
jgi:hypothetical protein